MPFQFYFDIFVPAKVIKWSSHWADNSEYLDSTEAVALI